MTWAGAHDGRSAVERRITELVKQGESGDGPACAVVVVAGNAGAEDGHFAATVTRETPASFTWLGWGRRGFTDVELAAARADLEAIAASPTRSVAPWYGGMTITIAAPCACARSERARQIAVELSAL